MIKTYPKIFAIGQNYIENIFDGEVEITEKLDGSLFAFAKINDELFFRSKGQQLFSDNCEKMFAIAVDYVNSIQDKIPNNTVYYTEYLNKPHHNTLNYNRTPINNLILFGVTDENGNFEKDYEVLKKHAEQVDIEIVPLLHKGEIKSSEQLLEFLDNDSILGGTKIEGIVVKNYNQPFLLGGQPIPLMMGKYVSEAFKEVHHKSWGKDHSTKGKWQTFKEGFKTEARWEKGIQHLAERGELENAPKDIGKLIKEIQSDITEEEKENIKEFLWKEYGSEILRYAVGGFPQWYKEKLLKQSFK